LKAEQGRRERVREKEGGRDIGRKGESAREEREREGEREGWGGGEREEETSDRHSAAVINALTLCRHLHLNTIGA
jgi:hypothetical protein